MVDLHVETLASAKPRVSASMLSGLGENTNMARPSEILFVDPGVSDLKTILGSVRPEVRAIVLDARWSATHQIAAALAGQEGLNAVHIVAHGAPGRVRFSAGEWSAATLG